MNRDMQVVRRALAPVDPAAAEPAASDVESKLRREQTLHLILSDRHADEGGGVLLRGSRRWTPAVAGLAAVAVLAVTGLVLISGRGGAYAATPPMLSYTLAAQADASAVLAEAASAASAADDFRSGGLYDYARTKGWYLDTSVRSDSTTTEVSAAVHEEWISPDGRGRFLDTGANGEVIDDQRFPDGGLSVIDQSALSRDPEVLASQLLGDPTIIGDDNSSVPDTEERFAVVSDLLTHAPYPPPDLRAALFRVLALEELTLYGHVQDREGRLGVAVGLDSDYSGLPVSYRLLLHPSTGDLLAAEQILTTDPGALDVEVPAVLSYTTLIEYGTAPSVEARPESG